MIQFGHVWLNKLLTFSHLFLLFFNVANRKLKIHIACLVFLFDNSGIKEVIQ